MVEIGYRNIGKRTPKPDKPEIAKKQAPPDFKLGK